MESKLDQFEVLLAMDSSYMPLEYGEDIFHYTSPSGFMSILFGDLDKTVLWASRYDCLNDISEGSVAEEVLREVCDELLANSKINQDLYKLFTKIKPARTILLSYYECGRLKITRPECDRYICSFSKNKDSLAMWNYYSKGNKYEGFNIGFFPFLIKESLEFYLREKEANFHIYPVVYERDEQKQFVKKLIMKIAEHYSKDQETSIRYIISNCLTDWGLVFKHECFKHEEEVRIVVDVAKREKNIPIDYRIVSNYIVPYIKLPLDKTSVSYADFGPLQGGEEQKKHQMKVM